MSFDDMRRRFEEYEPRPGDERIPIYLLDMPKRVLFGSCKAIEKWCRDNEKVRPTLLDLDQARRARKGERR